MVSGWVFRSPRLFQHLNICGFVGKAVAPRKNKKAAAEEVDIADDGLREMAKRPGSAFGLGVRGRAGGSGVGFDRGHVAK